MVSLGDLVRIKGSLAWWTVVHIKSDKDDAVTLKRWSHGNCRVETITITTKVLTKTWPLLPDLLSLGVGLLKVTACVLGSAVFFAAAVTIMRSVLSK